MEAIIKRLPLGYNESMESAYEVLKSGCWAWTRSKDLNGYGRVRRGAKLLYAHRIFYTHYKGAIPPGLHLDHLCRFTSCVNPDHLEAVELRTNTRRGETAKLNYAQVEEILQLIQDASISQRQIAKRYNVSPATITCIKQGLTWAK